MIRVSAIDPTQSFYNIKALEDVLSDSIAPRRFNLLLLGTFAIVALVLAALGVYGVVAYAVWNGLMGYNGGGGGGVFCGAWAATGLIAGLLYGVQPHDTATFVVTALALGAIACVACVVPALKAALVDPATGLSRSSVIASRFSPTGVFVALNQSVARPTVFGSSLTLTTGAARLSSVSRGADRNPMMTRLLTVEVLEKHRKALVLCGTSIADCPTVRC